MAEVKGNINAQGVGEAVRDAKGGNNTRGVLDQVRPTGIMATGRKGGRIQLPREGSERGGRGR